MKRLIISMFLLLYLSGCTASAEYVIGIGTGAMAASQKLFFEETAKYLEKEFGARTIELKGPIALGELKELIRTMAHRKDLCRVTMNSDRHFLSLKTQKSIPSQG